MANAFLELAYDVLKTTQQPLTYQEIWDLAKTEGLTAKLNTAGKTPWASLGAQLYVDVRDNPNTKLVKVGKRPARFFLKSRSREITGDTIDKLEREEAKKPEKKISYLEKDLHPLLAYFLYANLSFNRGRSIFSKTIFHEKSKKSGFSEWTHPDMIGFYLPIDDWDPEVIKFNKLSDNNSLHLFSFELKRGINKSNYREAFFQAVSNSSWAHEGYLVTVELLNDDELQSELERLAASFGIGIIQLDLDDFSDSKILFPARIRNFLDWETINKLCEQNSDFRKFIEDVRIDFESGRIHKSEYEIIIDDPNEYIEKRIGIKPGRL